MDTRPATVSTLTAFLLVGAGVFLVVGAAFASIPLGGALATAMGFGPVGDTPYNLANALARVVVMGGCFVGGIFGGFAAGFALIDVVFARKGRR